MQSQPSSPPKPVTDWWRPDLTELPRLTLARRIFRRLARGANKLIAHVIMRVTVRSLENFPKKGPALVVVNHVGNADVVLVSGLIPYSMDAIGKVENDEHWFVGPVFRAYGLIGVHRGKPDRKAIRSALDGLAEGRIIALAPEGRQTLTGGLEEGTDGAAFLALKSGAPIVPVALNGTENTNVYGSLKKWTRASVTLTVGKPFFIREQADRHAAMREGTRQIMESLARLLPESRRGVYKVNS